MTFKNRLDLRAPTKWWNWAPLIAAQHGPLETEVVSSPPGWAPWTGVSSCCYSAGQSRTCCFTLEPKAFPRFFFQTISCYSPTAHVFLLPYNNTELHSSHACPRLVRFIIFTRLQLCHLHFLSSLGSRKSSRCSSITVGAGQNLCSGSFMLVGSVNHL